LEILKGTVTDFEDVRCSAGADLASVIKRKIPYAARRNVNTHSGNPEIQNTNSGDHCPPQTAS
jgi:hypothetical protein